MVVENVGSPDEVARKAEALWRERVLPTLARGSDDAKESEER